MSIRPVELLAPAKDAEIARQAILHGADAVYIGPEDFGARKAAANSIDDIQRLVDFAHPYRAKVYATVNTIFYDREARHVEKLITRLYRAGVDAIIVQDMGILRLEIPPIALHASTQCHTDNPQKALFLQQAGFSQIVLARELSLDEIKQITQTVTVPVETFVHGALCVSYSGRCHISQACLGRSANRGQCAQFCRMPYTLTDAKGQVLAKNRYLLSLKDLNASDRIGDLIQAGVSSFKIEGRLKDADYVKNVTAYYRRLIDTYISEHPDQVCRSSCGSSQLTFTPALEKSFNRGFTHYFLDSTRPSEIASPLTPKSQGEKVTPSQLNNGDGVSYFDPRTGDYKGVRINKIVHGVPVPAPGSRIPKGVQLHRTYDAALSRQLAASSATRKIALDLHVTPTNIIAQDERGVLAAIPFAPTMEVAKTPRQLRQIFDKFGNTIYTLRHFTSTLPDNAFIPPSQIGAARKQLLQALDRSAAATYQYTYRLPENTTIPYGPTDGYRENIANRLAATFYRDHGVEELAPALETGKIELGSGDTLMTCRHCILRELGHCLKEGAKIEQPLTLTTANHHFPLRFDCAHCRMHLLHP